ncbi:hypothetical protein DCG74_16530 [Bradyrhizobium sp. WBAH42]|nr:hypothetical protein [Bradyrhizobium sp. WBAH30]MDD1540544.1 hypothetical protein [Bradyrhizobium sp. WBAH41]MDD1556010.1 hypothetical protein [Bradyrhizobium sp. WBAH23]MDD1563179.1 hypothetical protein [Bradyrhizobium sp. WBAH33]MDD1588318.1 hypothetical protein [Bradyrhizobium sp. WBAH42]NRB86238.1 hypothetical protein [Bradyrhizobium sp. WBAH10]QCJ89998.1 hypothetical protein DAA57_16975 [Bradyrhizobium yuanmingense]
MGSAVSHHDAGALPPPPAGEGWGEGVSAGKTPQEDRTLTRHFVPTSPASGRGAPRQWPDLAHQLRQAATPCPRA